MQKKLDSLLKQSYDKYSKVKVAAIATDFNDKEYKGVNIENAAFPSSICAERSAMFNAISNGVEPGFIKQIDLTSNVKRFLYPCGACVQVMIELMSENGVINIWYKNKKISKTLKDLLPNQVKKESFGWK